MVPRNHFLYMNSWITHELNSLIGHYDFFDAMVFVYAEFIPWLVGLFFCLLIVFSYKRTINPFVFTAFTLAGAGIVNALLKLFFNFQRPFEVHATITPLFITYGFGSFPSSHAFFFSILSTLSWFFLKRFAPFFTMITFIIGMARVVAGVHFFVDVLVGWALGVLLGYFAIRFYKKHIGNGI